MNLSNYFVILFLSVSGICLLLYYKKQKNPFLSFIKGTASGIVGLFVAKLVALSLGISFLVNNTVCAIAAIFGIPGIISISTLNYVMGIFNF